MMRAVYRKVLLVHTIAFFMLLLTWLAGEAIKTEAGTPFAALYYVLHIFPRQCYFYPDSAGMVCREPEAAV